MKNFVLSAVGAVMVLAGTTRAELVWGVTETGSLVSFDSASPATLISGVTISGLASNEQLSGIDIRPATGELYGLGNFSNLYRVNPLTGQATLVGALGTALDGSSFGFDFNPQIDRIRVVSDTNQNLVLNPSTGVATLATDVFYGPGDVNNGTDPNIVGAAYDNNVAGAASTQLFAVDSGLDILVRQANSLGTLTTVGALGVDINALVGFDISGATGAAFLVGQNEQLSLSALHSVNLATGAATFLGEIGGGSRIRAMTVAIPAPGAMAVLGLAGLTTARRRRAR